jgi:NADH-quinone oxidoreductase subunit N
MMPAFTADVARMLTPLFLLTLAGSVFLVFGALTRGVSRFQHILVGLFHIAILGSIMWLWNFDSWPILGGMLVVDKFALFFTGVCVLCSLATVAISAGYLHRFGISRSEYYAMLFFTVAGMFVLVSANDLIALFLGLELMSLSVYIMVAFRRRDFLSNEAAMKYFLLGAFAVAFMLYGMSLIYGLCGTFNFKGILVHAVDNEYYRYPPFLLAIALILIGFVFKVSAVPFHMWVPDVYQGAPSPVTGFMATAVKAASFAAFLRLFYMAFMGGQSQWEGVIVVLAVLTMTVGNIVALVQRNIKRMLAYSSIAHAGYILVGMTALTIDNSRAASSVMYYSLVYAVMTIGAFALVSALERPDRGGTRGLELEDYSGLGLRRPFLGLSMATFMFAMAGIPPTAGFFAKFYVFGAAVENGHVTLVVIAVMNSALSLYYYLRVVVYMYMRQPADGVEPPRVFDDMGVRVVLALSLIAVLWLGFGPSGAIPGVESVFDWANQSLARIAAVM